MQMSPEWSLNAIFSSWTHRAPLLLFESNHFPPHPIPPLRVRGDGSARHTHRQRSEKQRKREARRKKNSSGLGRGTKEAGRKKTEREKRLRKKGKSLINKDGMKGENKEKTEGDTGRGN